MLLSILQERSQVQEMWIAGPWRERLPGNETEIKNLAQAIIISLVEDLTKCQDAPDLLTKFLWVVLCNGFIPVSQRPQSQPWLRMSRYTPHARSCPCHAFAHQSLDRVRPMTTNDTARPKAWNYPLFIPLASCHFNTSHEGQWKGERREIQVSKKGTNTSDFSSSFLFSHHPHLCIRSSHLHSSIAFPRPPAQPHIVHRTTP